MNEQKNPSEAPEPKGPPRIQIQVQTPRGLWDMTTPETTTLRPEYPQSAKVQEVIDDACSVYKFVEADNQYTLFFNGQMLEPQRPLVSYGLTDGALLLLSVQGGNA